jgi:phage terminase large subunit-like protein
VFEPSRRQITWPNGAIATYYSSDKPEQLRGPQHDCGWADELASWRYVDAWDQLQFGMRLGSDPRIVVTSTPRPIKIIRDLLALASTVVTRGSTFDNAGNLAKQFLDVIVARYQNTRLGRQELYAQLLEDVEGALWNHAMLEADRVKVCPALKRIVISVDPSVSEDGTGDACGIIAAGRGVDNHGYCLEDGTLNASPDGWARRAVSMFHKWKADRIVAEANQGGALVKTTIRTVDPDVPISLVHASRGKFARAEPVSALAEQHRLHMVGMHAPLEDELCDWTPVSGDRSPNRLDAYVWGFTELLLGRAAFIPEVLRPR